MYKDEMIQLHQFLVYILKYLEIQKHVDIKMETIITSFISLLLELIHLVVRFLMFTINHRVILISIISHLLI